MNVYFRKQCPLNLSYLFVSLSGNLKVKVLPRFELGSQDSES